MKHNRLFAPAGAAILRLTGLVAGLTTLGAVLWPTTAAAAGYCFGVYPWDRAACEGAHHSSVFGMGGFLMAFVSIALGLLFGSGGHGLTRDAATAPKHSNPAVPKPPAAQPAGDSQPALPPLIDPWEGKPLLVQDGSYQGGKLGQVWYGGQWVDRDEAMRGIAADRVYTDQRDEKREAFSQESHRLSDQWLKDRVAALEAEAQKERDDHRRLENAWQTYQNVRDSAEAHGYDDVLSRADANALRPDGSVNVDFLERLGAATRNRIHRDLAAPDEALQQGWVADFATNTARDVAHNPLIRMGVGALTNGTSEIFYQSLAAGEKMQDAVNKAVDSGKDYSLTDALRTGAGVLADENLPTNTIRAMLDKNASWGDVGASVAKDAFATLGTLDTLRNLRSSFGAAGRGAGLKDVLNARAEPLNLLQRMFGEGEGAGGKKLWKDPSDATWQTEGASLRHIEEPHPGSLPPDKLPADIEARIRRVQDPAWRDPTESIKDMAFRHGRKAGAAKVTALENAGRDLEAARLSGDPEAIGAANQRMKDAVLEVQADKHAMHVLNEQPRDVHGNHPTIEKFNEHMDDMYRNADRGLRERLARDMNVHPSDVEIVKVTNVAGEGHITDTAAPPREPYGLATRQPGPLPEAPVGPGAVSEAAPAARGEKASYDRDLTARITTREGVVKDVPAEITGGHYAESFWEASTGKPLPTKVGPDGQLMVDRDALKAHLDRLDQMPTDRLHAEAYGTGPADLDTATKDAFRARDLTDPAQVGEAVSHKVNEWGNKAEGATAAGQLPEAMAHLEESQRQVIKQFDNWGTKRTEAMAAAGNARGAKIPPSLEREVNVLRRVGTDGLTPGQAETVLNQMGTSSRKVGEALGKYVEGQQVLRSPQQ